MQQNQNTSPAAVSARLRRAGFGIVATRNREGIRVSRGALRGTVCVTVDLDREGEAERLADTLHEELKGWEGYDVKRYACTFTVSKSAPAAPAAEPAPTAAQLYDRYAVASFDERPAARKAWEDAQRLEDAAEAEAAAPAAQHDMGAAWQFVVDSYDTGRGAHSPNRAEWSDADVLEFVAEHHVAGPDAFKLEQPAPGDVVLHHTAPWNARLVNDYRTRWAQHNGRMFKVASESLDGAWWVEIVDADGARVDPMQPGTLRLATTLADAREIIKNWK